MPSTPEVLSFLLPPVLGAFIGYGTNDLAIRMLFRPYRPIYLFKRQLPFTPGMIPKEQGRIALKVASTITTHLLTPDEIQRLSRRLVSEENVARLVDRVLDLVVTELSTPERAAGIAADLAPVADRLLTEQLSRLLARLVESDELDQAALVLNAKLNELMQDFRISKPLADFLADKALSTVLTPANLRLGLVWALGKENREVIAQQLRERAGMLGWMIDAIDPVQLLTRLRETLEADPQRAEETLGALLSSQRIKERLSDWFQGLRPEDLPWETVEAVRGRLVSVAKEVLETNDEAILGLAARSIDWRSLLARLLTTLAEHGREGEVREALRARAAGALHRFLDTEIEQLAARALEAIDLEAIIVKNINAFPPERVERIIYELSRRELKGIIYLGGALGFLVGCLQVALGFVLR